MPRILLTGFEAFPGVPSNPTERLVEAMPRRLGDAEVTKAILPVDTAAIGPALAALSPETFDGLVHTGVAHTRGAVGLERRAVNRLQFDVPDNRGVRPEDRPIDPSGPPERVTRLPVSALAAAFGRARVPVETSDDAGTYLCNQLMYISLGATRAPSGFIHVPPDEALAAQLGPTAPRVPFARLERGLAGALRAVAAHAGARS